MKLRLLSASLLLALSSAAALAQGPAGAPAGTTGVCKDGTFSNAAVKAGACSGHKGVKTWIGVAEVPAAAATPVVAATPATAASKPAVVVPAPASKVIAATPAAKAETPMAPGAAANNVWVNTESKVYHCPGTKYYGKTKKGAYMTEAEALAKGSHADHKKVCSK